MPTKYEFGNAKAMRSRPPWDLRIAPTSRSSVARAALRGSTIARAVSRGSPGLADRWDCWCTGARSGVSRPPAAPHEKARPRELVLAIVPAVGAVGARQRGAEAGDAPDQWAALTSDDRGRPPAETTGPVV